MSETHSFRTGDGTLLNVDIAGDGHPIIFLHGLCGDAAQPAEVFPQGFRRISIEARGHGKSEPGPLDRLSIATFADDVAAYIESRLYAPIVIGGISMGAAISLRLAVKRLDLVKGLILARPAWLTASAPDNMAPNAEVGELMKQLPPHEAKAQFLAGRTARFLAQHAPDNLASLTGFFTREPIAVTAALLTAISNDGPGVTEEEIAQIAVPTLVIGHEQDAVHPIGYARTLAAMIPQARFAEITPKVASRADYVADFRQTMTDFLAEVAES